MSIEFRAETIGKDWQGTGMVGHARLNGKMDKNVSRNLMTGLKGEEAGGSWRGGESCIDC